MTRSLSAALLFALLAGPATADDVRLRAEATVAHDATRITLADVAVLSGTHAERLASTVVADLPAATNTIELDLAEIRTRLTGAGVHWGRVNLSGRRVAVARATAPTVGAMQPRSLDARPLPMPEPRVVAPAARAPGDADDPSATLAHDLIAAPTLRGAIARAFFRGLGRDADDVRLRFSGTEAARLDAPFDELTDMPGPQGSLRAARVVFRPRHGGVDATFTVTVHPEVRTTALALTRNMSRSQVITADHVAARSLWCVPIVADTLCPPGEAAGRIATRRLRPGDMLRRIHVEQPAVVKRGDVLNVRCLVGGTVISLRAEARDDGAEGETIALRRIGDRKTFTARVSGPGEAVVDLSSRQ